METSAPTLRKLIFPLAFSLLCLILAIGVYRAFGGTVPFQAQPYTVTVNVPEGDALFANSDVRMAGVKIGRVLKVTGRRTSAELTLGLDKEFVPLRSGARAVVRNKSLLGEGYLELAPGPRTAAPIADGGRLAASQVRQAQRLDDVLQTFDPRTRGQLRQMASGIDGAFAGRAPELNAVLGTAPAALASIDTVVRALDDQHAELGELVSSASGVFGALGRQSGALQAAVRQGQAVFSATASRDRQLQATLAALPPFIADLRAAAVGIDGASADIRTAAHSLRPTVALLRPAVDALADRTATFSTVFRRLSPVLSTAEAALPATTRTLNTVTPTFPAIHMAGRQLLPFVTLASADRASILANFANVAATWNGRSILPGNREAGHFSAWLTAWNEISGGWVKKLPTNRSNPYPKPGPMSKFADGGLEAYDCRNVNNPAILPAIGAAPPCRLQGPYEFMGKTRYYPRLELPEP